jgi:hypothetical protein
MINLKRKYFNYVFLGKVLSAFVFMLGLVQLSTGIYQLASKDYLVTEADIYRVDSFRLQGIAFYNSGGKGKSPYYDFTSTNGYSFTIDNFVFDGIINKKEFRDTFCYHNLKFIAYSDQKTAALYRKSKTPIFIDLLQVQVGDKKYISVENINESHRNKFISNLVVGIFLLAFLTIRFLRTGKIFEDVFRSK